jgi:5-keto-L-gluconate epimerase
VSDLASHDRNQRAGGIAVSPSEASFVPLLYAGRLDQAVRDAAELGLEFLELSVRDPRSVDPVAVGLMLEAAGLRCSAIATGQACLADGLCLAAVDEHTRRAASDRFAAQAALAQELGAAVILGGVRGTVAARREGSAARRRDAVRAISACVNAASQRGVKVLLEPINRYETDFVNSCEEGLELLEEVGDEAAALLLDTFHMNIEERALGEAIAMAGDRLGYVHMVDSNRHAPGLGHIDFGEVLSALSRSGFHGPIVAEVLPLPSDREAAAAAASFFAGALPPERTAVS